VDPVIIHTLRPHELLEWLLACGSRDEIHATIHEWLRANPRPRTWQEIKAYVDEVLAGCYLPPDGYDPRIVSPILDELSVIVLRIARESGRGAVDAFDARRWTHDWAHLPHPALDGKSPVLVLHTPEGVGKVRKLLERESDGYKPDQDRP
jgi:hypothetical protein